MIYGISIAGQLSDQILFWTWFVFTCILLVLFKEEKWIKWFKRMLGALGILRSDLKKKVLKFKFLQQNE